MEQGVGLADLHKRGADLTITGDEGEVTVWIQKMSIGEQEEALRRARAKSAVALSRIRSHDSDEFAVMLSDAYALGDLDDVITFLVTVKMRETRQEAKVDAQLAAEDEWADDGYLQGLRDAWVDGLKDVWVADSADPDAARVFSEMERFSAQCAEELERIRGELRSDWDGLPAEDVYEKAAEKLAEAAANDAFNKEYWKTQMWLATRRHTPSENPDGPHPEHAEKHFPSREAVDDLAPETYAELQLGFAMLEVDEITGKGSPPDPQSSTLSEPAGKAATAASSGRLAASL